jgi:hypothetical protein
MATPTQVRDCIQQITGKSQALQVPAQSITIVNGPLIIIGEGPYPKICDGLADIVSTTISKMDGMSQVAAGKDADAIHEAVREVTHLPHASILRSSAGLANVPQFVRINQTLFNMLIAKAELFKSKPMISRPVGASIRMIAGAYNVRSSMCCASTQIHANIERSILLSPLSTTFQVVRRISSLNSELFRKQCSKRSSRTKRWTRIDWRNGGKSGAASSPSPCWWSSRTAELQHSKQILMAFVNLSAKPCPQSH